MYRNRKILDLPRDGDIPCCGCGKSDGTIVAAHSNSQRHGKGMGIKAHDCFVAYLCHSCHHYVDQGKAARDQRQSFWQMAHVHSLRFFWHLLDEEGRNLMYGEIE